MWVIGAVAALAAVVALAWRSITRGDDDIAGATLIFTTLAAVAAMVGTVATLVSYRRTTRYQGRLESQQGQIVADIGRLAELTESSIEEARALRPRPLLRFLVGEDREPVDSALLVRSLLRREIDLERILTDERERALETLPDIRNLETWAGDHYVSSVVRFAALASSLGVGPVTEAERSEFESRVDEYVDSLRAWIGEYLDWRDTISQLFVTDLQFENRGRVPARDLVVQLRSPEPFEAWENPPDSPERPTRPRFERRSPFDILGMSTPALRIPEIAGDFHLPSIEGNVSNPRYRDGSVVVELDVGKLLHGVPEETDDPLVLRVPDDGDYVVTWQIHAENLEEPASGELALVVETEPIDGPPISSLSELLATDPAQTDQKKEDS